MTRDGQPAANRLEMLLLEAGMTCQTTQPTLSVLYDDKLPEEFLLKAVECEKSRFYQRIISIRTRKRDP